MKLNKADIKHLKGIASKLPVCFTSESQNTIRLVLGSFLIERGVLKDKNGIKIDPNKKYSTSVPGGVKVNHFKRLKVMCENDRFDEAQNYINEVSDIGSEHVNLLAGMSKRAQIL